MNKSTSDNPIEKQVREHLEASLKRLGTDHVELYYLHRINPAVPVEDVAEPMGKLIREGKIRGWGQSQSTPDQIRHAHAITPLSAIQSEYSMMERMFEKEVLPLCQELNIGSSPSRRLRADFCPERPSLATNTWATMSDASSPGSIPRT